MAEINTLDGGMGSRKLWFCIGAALVIAVVGVLTIWAPGLAAIYPELIGGVLGACAMYCGANVTNTLVTSRAPAFTASASPPPPPPTGAPTGAVPPPVPPPKPPVVMEPQG